MKQTDKLGKIINWSRWGTLVPLIIVLILVIITQLQPANQQQYFCDADPDQLITFSSYGELDEELPFELSMLLQRDPNSDNPWAQHITDFAPGDLFTLVISYTNTSDQHQGGLDIETLRPFIRPENAQWNDRTELIEVISGVATTTIEGVSTQYPIDLTAGLGGYMSDLLPGDSLELRYILRLGDFSAVEPVPGEFVQHIGLPTHAQVILPDYGTVDIIKNVTFRHFNVYPLTVAALIFEALALISTIVFAVASIIQSRRKYRH